MLIRRHVPFMPIEALGQEAVGEVRVDLLPVRNQTSGPRTGTANTTRIHSTVPTGVCCLFRMMLISAAIKSIAITRPTSGVTASHAGGIIGLAFSATDCIKNMWSPNLSYSSSGSLAHSVADTLPLTASSRTVNRLRPRLCNLSIRQAPGRKRSSIRKGILYRAGLHLAEVARYFEVKTRRRLHFRRIGAGRSSNTCSSFRSPELVRPRLPRLHPQIKARCQERRLTHRRT